MSYFKIILRHFSRHKVQSVINIVGLSIGLASCMLILLYINDELSFDKFHKNANNIYQLTCKVVKSDGNTEKYAFGGMLQGPAFKRNIPEILDFVRVNDNNEVVVLNEGHLFPENITWADDNFFNFFSFNLVEGNPGKVLSDPHSVVLTKSSARKYFGNSDPIGKVLEIQISDKFEQFKVSGIAEDPPENSSINFRILIPFKYYETYSPEDSWMITSYNTFFLIEPKKDIGSIEAKMKDIFYSQDKTEINESNNEKDGSIKYTWGLRPLLSAHFDQEFENTPSFNTKKEVYSYVLSSIALFILIIACINYINLNLAQASSRTKEIGVRKVMGSNRLLLVFHFLGESFITCLIAFTIALSIAVAGLPYFNILAEKNLSFNSLWNYRIIISIIILFTITIILSGLYPAIVVSKLNPVEALANRTKIGKRSYLTKGLVIIQFAISSFLIVISLLVHSQFNFLTTADLGYDDKNLLSVTVGQGNNKNSMAAFKSEFSKIPGVVSVAPRMQGEWGTTVKILSNEFIARYEHIDEDYFKTLKIPVIRGRNFSRNFPADSTHSVIINEAFARKAGWKDSLIGRTINYVRGVQKNFMVVGVIRDYVYENLRAKIKPQLFSVDSNLPYGKFLIRIRPEYTSEIINEIKGVCKSVLPYQPVKIEFMDQINRSNYATEERAKEIVLLSTIVSVLISVMGLMGLSWITTKNRTKEMGIRKILGASSFDVLWYIVISYLPLILISLCISFPIAWVLLSSWLQQFAFHVPLKWVIFLITAILVTATSMVTIILQSINIAYINPIETIREE
jgi:putative ABC transport system permease protein